MQLELKKSALKYYDIVFEGSVLKEESADVIVPDMYPDALRIIAAAGLASTKEKNIRDGQAEVSGAVKVSVLYQPENENGVARLDVTVPFSHSFENAGIPPEAVLTGGTRLISVAARAVNPRKIQVSVSVSISVRAYVPQVLSLSNGVESDSVEVLGATHEAYMPVAAAVKSFALSDDAELPLFDQLLHADTRLETREMKLIGSKLVLKGVALLKLLYSIPGSTRLGSHNAELDFSQIIELSGADEDATLNAELYLNSIDLEPQVNGAGEQRLISVTLGIEAQVTAHAERRIETIADIYSTGFELQPQLHGLKIEKLSENASKRHNVRELFNTQEPVASIVDCTAALSPLTERSTEGGSVLYLEVRAWVLYAGEQGDYFSDEYVIPLETPVPENVHMESRAFLNGEVHASGSSEGVELRFAVDVESIYTSVETVSVVESVTADWETPRDNSGAPSVVLRRTRDGETLWDIAKSYYTTRADIIQANSLDIADGEPALGTMLLIPKKR